MRALVLFSWIGFSSLSLATLVAARMPLHPGGGGGSFSFADSNLVVFNVSVTDSKGQHVAGLKAGDFHVREENQTQDIKLFNAEDGPASVGLIVDNSGRMLDKRADVAKAALAFTSASNSEDEMFVITFNDKVSLGLPASMRFTRNSDQIHSALVHTPPTGMTALYDAIAVGIEHLQGGTREQKALVVLSDGGDNASRRPLEDVIHTAQRSSATIYAIGIYDSTEMDRNAKILTQIAELSGGRAYFPDAQGDMDHVWREIAQGIRNQYTIGYLSTNAIHDGRFRAVTITAAQTGSGALRIATRPGYLVPADSNITK